MPTGTGGFGEWAAGRGLKPGGRALRGSGSMISHEADEIEAYKGKLATGLDGSIAHFAYSYESGGDTVHQVVTIAVTSVPETIGFAPYLSIDGLLNSVSMKEVGERLEKYKPSGYTGEAKVRVRKGTSQSWLMRLFSPALIDWLERSPDDLSAELAEGTLAVFRKGLIDDPVELDALCADLAHLARSLSEEALDGSVSSLGMERPKADKAADVVLGAAQIEGPLASVSEARPALQRLLTRSPAQWFGCALAGLFILLLLNIPGIAVPILLIGSGHWPTLVLVEGLAWVIVAVVFFRQTVSGSARAFAEEAFFRDYAARNGLRLVAPLPFVAAHAAAKLPFQPDRVLAGGLDGLPQGAIAIKGSGAKRGDVVAVVAGPLGPVAQEPLETTGVGLTAEQLGGITARLAAELR